MTETVKFTGEPCPSCPTGDLKLISGRTQAFFGQVLSFLDLVRCDICGFWREVAS